MRLEELPNTCGVYAIVNTVNKKMYIGSSLTIYSRISGHVDKLSKNEHHNVHLQGAWNKYGADVFDYSVLYLTEPVALLTWEQFCIDNAKACDPEFGYNMSPLAYSSAGVKLSEETLLRIGAANKKKWESEEYRAKLAECRVRDWERPERHEAMRELMQKKWADPEYRAKVIARMRGGKQRKRLMRELAELSSEQAALLVAAMETGGSA